MQSTNWRSRLASMILIIGLLAETVKSHHSKSQHPILTLSEDSFVEFLLSQPPDCRLDPVKSHGNFDRAFYSERMSYFSQNYRKIISFT